QPDQPRRFFHCSAGAPGRVGAAAVWRLPGKWLFGVADGRTPGFHRDGWSPPYPASQGNRASSTAMARVVVSWGATRTGMAAGDVVRRARRARWLRPEALPPRAPRRRSCEGVLLNSVCELSAILSSGHHIRSGGDTKQVRPSILRVGPSHTGNQPPGAHPRVLSPGRESQFESSTGRRRFNCSNFPHYVDGSRDPAYRENRALPSTATILPARWARRFPASVARLPAVSSGFLAFLRFTPRVS